MSSEAARSQDLSQARVGDLVAAEPSTSRVFRRHGIDFCCGGGRTVEAACRSRGADPAVVVEELRCALEHDEPGADDRADWRHEDPRALARFIVERYHVPLREELQRLGELSRKVASVHGARSPEVWPVLDAVLGRFSTALLDHMECEERVLFPLVAALCAAEEAGAPAPRPGLARPVAAMEGDHDRAGADLATLHRLTHGYRPDPDACNTTRALLDGLAQLERDMQDHVHLENAILFPRALELERRLAARDAP